ncbi:hypothetical protein [Calidifontibacter indicus]|uniref:hypothetical protein n=1 Tax=Calidifontibacter indicus TaxID=419650 RepID=UPI003D73C90A
MATPRTTAAKTTAARPRPKATADDPDTTPDDTTLPPSPNINVDGDQEDDESLSARIVAEDTPTAKPAGSPQMVPLSAVGRRVRGEFQRTWMEPYPDEMLKQITAGGGLTEADILASADVIRNAGLIVAAQEDALRLVAFSAEAFDAWAAKVDDEQIRDLFAWYQGRYGSGE